MDPTEVRRTNFIPPDAFPYETAAGLNYDSGEYEKTLTRRWRSPTTPSCARAGAAPRGGPARRHRRRHLTRDLRLRPVRERPRCGSSRAARSPSSPASRRTARARRRPSPRSSPTNSAPIRRDRRPPRRHRQHPAGHRHDGQPRPGRRRLGADGASARSARRRARSPPTCWRSRRRTSARRRAVQVKGAPDQVADAQEIAAAAYSGRPAGRDRPRPGRDRLLRAPRGDLPLRHPRRRRRGRRETGEVTVLRY